MNKRINKGNSILDFPTEYVVIDIETTGFNPNCNSIIELAAIKVIDNKIVDKFNTLVKDDRYFLASDDETDYCIVNGEKVVYVNGFISKLTGITNTMLNDAPFLKDNFPEFIDFISSSILVGHNVSFDINFLYDSYYRFHNKYITNDFIDTLRLSRRLLPELEHHRLGDISSYFKINNINFHRALDDCIATYNCFLCLQNIYNTKLEQLGSDAKKILSKTYNYYGNQLKAEYITAQTSNIDTFSPVYNKVCVFTGTLDNMTRKEAMQIIANLGGINADRVTQKTNYLILGNNDYCPLIKDGKSKKQKYAENLKLNGYDIEILTESSLWDMLDDFLPDNN